MALYSISAQSPLTSHCGTAYGASSFIIAISMRTIFLPILSVFLLVGAGCISSSQDVGQVPDGESVNKETVALTADEDTLSMTTYRTSGKSVIVFDAPTGWFVRQSDGGGFSSVTIRETKTAQVQASITIEQPWPDDDGHRATYDEWLVLRGLTQAVDRQDATIPLTFDAWSSAEGDAIVYTVVLDPQTPYYLRVVIPTALDQTIGQEILRSINPSATQIQQDVATPVSEWTLEDTRE